MKKPNEESLYNFVKTVLNFTVMVAVGCPIALYILYRLDVISDMGLGYIFLPGYLLMLIVILLFRLAWGCSNVEEIHDDK